VSSLYALARREGALLCCGDEKRFGAATRCMATAAVVAMVTSWGANGPFPGRLICMPEFIQGKAPPTSGRQTPQWRLGFFWFCEDSFDETRHQRPGPFAAVDRQTSGSKKLKREPACKPNFVPRHNRGGDHSSSPAIARGIQRPTRESPVVARRCSRRSGGIAERAAPPLLFGLAPCGVFPAPDVTVGAVRSYIKPRPAGPHLFTLISTSSRRYIFCGTFRAGGVRPLQESPADPRC